MSERNYNHYSRREYTADTNEKETSEKVILAEDKKKQTIRKFIIISAIVIAMLAIVALIYNITMLSSTNAQNRRYLEQQQFLALQIEQNEIDIYFRQSPEYIENFARYYLNMHHRDEVVFIAR